MKMAGGASTPCIRTTYGETLPCKIRRLVGKQTATCRDFVWDRDMPSAERCDESIFQHADCCGGWCIAWREHFNDRLMVGTDPR